MDPQLRTSADGLKGLTIAAVHSCRDELGLAFTDGSFCFLEAGNEGAVYDDSPYVEFLGEGEITPVHLHILGFISEEEKHRRLKERYTEQQRKQRETEREQYERLRAKFEGLPEPGLEDLECCKDI